MAFNQEPAPTASTMGFLDKLRGKDATAGKATDPVCGMTIETANAAGRSQHGAQTYHFCSAACKSRFDVDPHAYLGAHSH